VVITYNVNELLHFTLALRLDFPHLQRDKCTELISLRVFWGGLLLIGGQNKNRAHICKYLGRERFPNLPEDLASPWCGDAANITVSLSRFIEGLV